MKQYSIRQRLVALLLIPLASVLLFGVSTVIERRRETAEMHLASRLAHISVSAGQLLHQAQKERGLSVGFIGSRGDAGFRSKLADQRKQTDAAAGPFRAAVEQSGQPLGEELLRGYAEVKRSLQELAPRRDGVDTLSAAAPEVLAFYSGLNHRVLAMVTEMARAAGAVEIARRGTAYASFMRAKEAAGIERAVLSNTFGAGKFGAGMYGKLLTMIAIQDEYLSAFRAYGGQAAWRQYETAMTGAFVEATRAMRGVAIASGGGAVEGTDPKEWFARQTEKIDSMAKVESWLATDILETASAVADRAHRAFTISLLGMTAVLLVTLALAALVVRSIVRPLSLAVDVLGSVAGQISSACEQLARGAQTHATNLEETAAALEELTTTVRQNSENATAASQLAMSSREVAERGGKIVGQAVSAMGEINQSAKRISEISTAMDEIAFQTNLLALNAAVEAARAGEQGRGFAVVASAVRELAQRSSTSAKEIKSLIQQSVRSVEAGAGLVNKSGQILEEILTSVKGVTNIVAEMASASREQAIGIEQVSLAVSQMDQVTQGSVAQTEELSGTAEGMAFQAEQLRALVARPGRVAGRDHHREKAMGPSLSPIRAPLGGGRGDARMRSMAFSSHAPQASGPKGQTKGNGEQSRRA